MSRIQRLGLFVAAAAASVAFAAVLVRSNVLDQVGDHAAAHMPDGDMPPAGGVKPAEGGFPLPAKAASREGRGTFIVMFEEAPLATYRGGVAGIPAPPRDRLAKNGRMRLDPTSATSRAYVAYLQERQAEYAKRMSSMAGRALNARMSMQHAINAMVVDMSREEVDAVRGLAGVSIVEEYREFEFDTDTGPGFIGAESVWNGATPGSGGPVSW
jgi:hypothetical protein